MLIYVERVSKEKNNKNWKRQLVAHFQTQKNCTVCYDKKKTTHDEHVTTFKISVHDLSDNDSCISGSVSIIIFGRIYTYNVDYVCLYYEQKTIDTKTYVYGFLSIWYWIGHINTRSIRMCANVLDYECGKL